MKLITLIVLLYTSYATAAQWGEGVACVKDQACALTLPGGSSLNVTLDRDATVSVKLYLDASTALNLPNGLIALSFSANAGFTFEVSPSTAVVVSARFVTPSLTIASAAYLIGNFKIGCLQYDSNLNWYNEFTVDSIDSGSRTLNVTLPSAGTYVFAAISVGATVPALYNKERDVPANEKQKVEYPFGLFLEVTSQTQNTLNVTISENNPKSKLPEGKVAYGYFWEFKATTEDNVDATISFVYNKTVIAQKAINEASLRLAFYNEASGSWEFLSSGGSVDTQSSTVVQVTPHFSTWAAFGEPTENDSSAINMSINVLLIGGLLALLRML